MVVWPSVEYQLATQDGWDADHAVWTSPTVDAGFRADEAIISWNLPADVTASWQVRPGDQWLDLAIWDAKPGSSSRRTSYSASHGPFRVNVDTIIGSMSKLEVRATFSRPISTDEIRVWVNFSGPAFTAPLPDKPAVGDNLVGIAAQVKPLSQRELAHRTDLGGGGNAWCAATSLTMVCLAYGVDIPTDSPEPQGDPRVAWVASRVWDSSYDGTGNWVFNAALAGTFGLSARVVRLRSLDDMATFTSAGTPLICSLRFHKDEMPGADYSTAGHLLVVLGLTPNGDVRVADPACTTPQKGLRTYPRESFDRAWRRSRRSVIIVERSSHDRCH